MLRSRPEPKVLIKNGWKDIGETAFRRSDAGAHKKRRIQRHAQSHQQTVDHTTQVGVAGVRINLAGDEGGNKQDQHGGVQPGGNAGLIAGAPDLEAAAGKGDILNNNDDNGCEGVDDRLDNNVGRLVLGVGGGIVPIYENNFVCFTLLFLNFISFLCRFKPISSAEEINRLKMLDSLIFKPYSYGWDVNSKRLFTKPRCSILINSIWILFQYQRIKLGFVCPTAYFPHFQIDLGLPHMANHFL